VYVIDKGAVVDGKELCWFRAISCPILPGLCEICILIFCFPKLYLSHVETAHDVASKAKLFKDTRQLLMGN
jgi:hypothetical protein